jgi:hypothetical protein
LVDCLLCAVFITVGAQNLGLLFSTVKVIYLKKWLSNILGYFFTSSFGHTGGECVRAFSQNLSRQKSRVARWYIFKPKLQILLYFGRSWSGMLRYILSPFGILKPFGALNCLLLYFVVSLAYFSPFWFNLPRKIWQPRAERFFKQSGQRERSESNNVANKS